VQNATNKRYKNAEFLKINCTGIRDGLCQQKAGVKEHSILCCTNQLTDQERTDQERIRPDDNFYMLGSVLWVHCNILTLFVNDGKVKQENEEQPVNLKMAIISVCTVTN